MRRCLGADLVAPLLKLCGNHSAADTDVSFQSTADYLGFVFAKSKRQVNNAQVKEWLKGQENIKRKKLVALFVNAALKDIVAAIDGIPFDVIQCHGSESAIDVAEIKRETNLSVWKVIHHHAQAVNSMKEYDGIVDGFVIDCKVGDQWGGTGVSFDWRFVPPYLEEGKRQGVPVFIAGGIKPENVAELLPYQPDGIDVSSGIEQDRRKSIERVRQLEERMNRHGNDLPR